jgi:hypothetical protein
MIMGNYCIDKAKLTKIRQASRLLLGYMMAANSTIGEEAGKATFIINIDDHFKAKFNELFNKNDRAFKTAMNELTRLNIVTFDEGSGLYNISNKCFNIDDIDPQYIKFNDVLEDVLGFK